MLKDDRSVFDERGFECGDGWFDIVDRLLPLDPGRRLLQKPYSAAELALAVRRCLDAPRA